MAIQLREGVSLDQAIGDLTNLGYELGNAQGGAGQGPKAVAENYIRLIERVEPGLRNFFTDPAVWDHLYGRRYWAIRDITSDSPRWGSLVSDEAQEQRRYVEGLVERMKLFQAWVNAAPGRMAVLDTNVLLHYQPARQIHWAEVLKLSAVRLVLPLRVVEELDAKKYLARDDLADRARRILTDLWALVGPVAGRPVELAPGVTVEVPVDEERERALDADAEILALCSSLKAVGVDVVLVTGDTSMSLRATTRRIDVRRPPDKYLRRAPNANSEGGL